MFLKEQYIFLSLLFGMLQLGYGQIKQRSEFDKMMDQVIKLDSVLPSHALADGLKVLAYADQLNYNHGIIEASLLVCKHYIRNGSDAKALFYASRAEKKCTLSDYFSRVKLKRIKGKCLTRLGFYEVAEDELKEALYYAEKLGNSKNKIIQKGLIHAEIGNNFLENSETQKAVEHYRKSLELFERMSDSDPIKEQYKFFILVKIASFYRSQKQYDKMRLYLKRAVVFSDSLKDNQYKAEFFYNQGIVSSDDNNLKLAKDYYQKALHLLKHEHKIRAKKELYYELSQICRNLKIPDSCRYYREQYTLYNDSLYRMYKKDVNMALHFFEGEKQSELKERSLNYSYIIMLCTIIFIMVSPKLFRFHRKFVVLQEEKVALENQLKDRNVVFEALKNKNSQILNDTINLEKLAREGSPAFLIEFKKRHPDFCQKLMQRNQSISSDLKFCALIKLNYTTIQMADYTNSTIRAIESRKYRIRKKLGITKDENIYEWFQKL